MRPVQHPPPRPLGHRTRDVAQLGDPVETQRADAIDVHRVEPGFGRHFQHQLHRLPRVARQGRDQQHRGVARHVDDETRAEPAERLVQFDAVPGPRPVVEEVAGESGEARPAGRIGRGNRPG